MKPAKKNNMIVALVLGFFSLCFINSAEGKPYRIASLNTAEQFVDAFEGFKSRMAELGYREGQDVRYEFYNAQGSIERLDRLAQKIVGDKVDLIVTSSTTATIAAAKVTKQSRTPVVFLSAGNPQKLIRSYAGSGSNLAGISSATLEIAGKRFELLRELVPQAKRIEVFYNPKGVNYQASLRETKSAAKKLGFTLLEVMTTNREEVAQAASAVSLKRADAIYTSADSMISGAIEIIVERSIKERMPLITALLGNVKKGCLATYAADYFSLGRQGALLVDKILKGTKPSDLPIEQPTNLKLVINLKTARAIGLKIPKEILIRADELIEQ